MATPNKNYKVYEKLQLLLDFLIFKSVISSMLWAKNQASNLKYSFHRPICLTLRLCRPPPRPPTGTIRQTKKSENWACSSLSEVSFTHLATATPVDRSRITRLCRQPNSNKCNRFLLPKVATSVTDMCTALESADILHSKTNGPKSGYLFLAYVTLFQTQPWYQHSITPTLYALL